MKLEINFGLLIIKFQIERKYLTHLPTYMQILSTYLYSIFKRKDSNIDFYMELFGRKGSTGKKYFENCKYFFMRKKTVS